jgi:hypothetical protein
LLIVDSIDVKGDPIGFLFAIREEIFLDLFFDLRDALYCAKLGFVPRDFSSKQKLHFFRLPLSDSKVDQMLERKNRLLVPRGETGDISNWPSMQVSSQS